MNVTRIFPSSTSFSRPVRSSRRSWRCSPAFPSCPQLPTFSEAVLGAPGAQQRTGLSSVISGRVAISTISTTARSMIVTTPVRWSASSKPASANLPNSRARRTSIPRISSTVRAAPCRATYQREMDSLESHLAFLASGWFGIPYIGLFGTVWGIMHAFRGLSNVGRQRWPTFADPGVMQHQLANVECNWQAKIRFKLSIRTQPYMARQTVDDQYLGSGSLANSQSLRDALHQTGVSNDHWPYCRIVGSPPGCKNHSSPCYCTHQLFK